MDCFDASYFKRSFSYRDWLTSFALAILFLAIAEIFSFYSAGNTAIGAKFTLLFILLLANHVIYKLEHKRSNNFIGRSIHDAIFIGFLVITKSIYSLILARDTGLEPKIELLFLIVGLVILIFLIELGVALIKRFFNLLKWQIL